MLEEDPPESPEEAEANEAAMEETLVEMPSWPD